MPDIPIIAPATGTAAQARRYILRAKHGAYTADDIDQIVQGYWTQCLPLGIDPVMVVAQTIYETGNFTSWWAQRPRRNPAGIGVTGRRRLIIRPRAGTWAQRLGVWVEGVSFPTWHDHAIPAHLGRLLAYALPEGQGTPAQQAQIVRALAVRDLPAHIRGVAAAGWHGLNGRWAVPGTDYSARIARIAAAIRQS
jgi:hypothetical protein